MHFLTVPENPIGTMWWSGKVTDLKSATFSKMYSNIDTLLGNTANIFE